MPLLECQTEGTFTDALGGMPRDVVGKIHAATAQALRIENVQDKFEQSGIVAVIPSRKATRDYMQQGEPNAKS